MLHREEAQKIWTIFLNKKCLKPDPSEVFLSPQRDFPLISDILRSQGQYSIPLYYNEIIPYAYGFISSFIEQETIPAWETENDGDAASTKCSGHNKGLFLPQIRKITMTSSENMMFCYRGTVKPKWTSTPTFQRFRFFFSYLI